MVECVTCLKLCHREEQDSFLKAVHCPFRAKPSPLIRARAGPQHKLLTDGKGDANTVKCTAPDYTSMLPGTGWKCPGGNMHPRTPIKPILTAAEHRLLGFGLASAAVAHSLQAR